MNPSPNEFENQLASLRPRSASPGLKLRIGAELAPGPRLGRWYAPLAVAASIAVAAALLALFAPSPPAAPSPPTVLTTAPYALSDSSYPTLLAYRRALSESEEQLTELLDAHALASGASHSDSTAQAPLRWRDALTFP